MLFFLLGLGAQLNFQWGQKARIIGMPILCLFLQAPPESAAVLKASRSNLNESKRVKISPARDVRSLLRLVSETQPRSVLLGMRRHVSALASP